MICPLIMKNFNFLGEGGEGVKGGANKKDE
jgi:hypothetical protein